MVSVWAENSQRRFSLVTTQWISLNPEFTLWALVPNWQHPPGPSWHSHSHNLSHFPFLSYSTIYRELERTILAANTQEDLKWFSNNHGPGMHMNWPAFEVQHHTFIRRSFTSRTALLYAAWMLFSIIFLTRNTTQTRPVLLQRRRNQTEPHPLRALTTWLHLVTVVG